MARRPNDGDYCLKFVVKTDITYLHVCLTIVHRFQGLLEQNNVVTVDLLLTAIYA
jgi:hypothetical protein